MTRTAAGPRIAAETGAAAPALEVSHLSVTYRYQPVLSHVSLRVQRGQMVVVVGPNGAGKSTLLKAILGLVAIDNGEIRVFGRPVAAARRQIAYVPQTDSADWDFPVTVREVVLMGRYGALGWIGRPRKRDWEIVAQSLETVGMSALAERHIRQLSGGQQQRVFLARALAQQSEILLLDEPFAGVDARTQGVLFDLMDRFARDGKTLIVVDHNLQMLHRFDAVLLLNQRVIAYGPPGEVVNEANLRATYGGRMGLLDEAARQLAEGPADVR